MHVPAGVSGSDASHFERRALKSPLTKYLIWKLEDKILIECRSGVRCRTDQVAAKEDGNNRTQTWRWGDALVLCTQFQWLDQQAEDLDDVW